MKTWQKIVAIIGGAVVGGLGVAAVLYPDMAQLFGGISGSVGMLITTVTGVALVKGE